MNQNLHELAHMEAMFHWFNSGPSLLLIDEHDPASAIAEDHMSSLRQTSAYKWTQQMAENIDPSNVQSHEDRNDLIVLILTWLKALQKQENALPI